MYETVQIFEIGFRSNGCIKRIKRSLKVIYNSTYSSEQHHKWSELCREREKQHREWEKQRREWKEQRRKRGHCV
jgi:hypothetical protein